MPKNSRIIGIRELKARASAVLREVQDIGAEFVITVHGRPVARIEPISGDSVAVSVDAMGGSRGTLSHLPKLSWRNFKTAKKIWEPKPPDAK